MSRGGRGGGRGGYSGPPGSKLNHGTVPFEIDPLLLARVEELHKTSGIFPRMHVPRPRPVTRAELASVEAYRELRAKRQLGPYYFPSTSHDLSRRSKRQRTGRDSERSTFNAFEDQKTYLAVQDDMRRAFKEAEYSKLPFPKDLLPKELWGVCGIADGSQYWPNMRGDHKSLLSMKQKLARIDDAEEAEEEPEELEEKDPDDSDKEPNEDEDKDDAASDRDDDFEDAEDDMAADYNAEQYFDGGEDDNDDAGHGDGGGGGGDDW
ncbi:hypothetical protein AMS68_000619 [Peltaster fructicola]|uniref:DNA-directed RNA polymerase III subunit n=1 Tax=Peltaster fructicola TaxID=286661 RepID=A0A6H0XK53_9PEZI|nr:hypothetical protein AMS68_000619 [Peltaster fructicola]